MSNHNLLSGLTYIPDFITVQQHNELVESIDQNSWSSQIKRRVQQYGYEYNYKSKAVNFLGELPNWSLSLLEKLQESNLIAQKPNQLIVNEYQPGQGILGHIDSILNFGEPVISISLCSPCTMIFSRVDSEERVPILLEPGSLLILRVRQDTIGSTV